MIMEITYTYILKDKKLDIYKIGKTKNPPSRFQNLCAREEIVPIALISKDVEKDLHTLFDSNRMNINTKAESGRTEWFKYGGVFAEFIDTLDVEKTIPFLSAHYIIKSLVKKNRFKVLGYSSDWKFSQIGTGYYVTGYNMLKALKVIIDGEVSEEFEEYGDTFEGRSIFNKEFVEYISDNYEVYLTLEGNDVAFSDIKDDKSIISTVVFKKEKINFIMLIKKSIITKENYF